VNLRRIYLDNAATTPLRTEVADAMREAFAESGFFNPSSLHAEGRRARGVLDGARDRVASTLGTSRKEITFTASGTEADNQALLGVVRGIGRRGHVVASCIEHHAVIHALECLREDGFDVTLLPVGSQGLVDPAVFAAALRADTLLASVMYANNEIGTVQPIAELAAIAHDRGVLFHTDAVQAPGWLPIDVRRLGVDLLSLSGHKFGGPQGVGLLYVRAGTAIAPIFRGGGQEFGRRAGTENVIGIAGLARALELAVEEQPEREPRIAGLRDRFEASIRSTVDDVRVNGAGAPRLANNLNVSFAGVESEALLIRLDLEGVAVSAGSACTSGALEPSHVIAALGLEPRWLEGPIRFSLGATTSSDEIDRVLTVLPRVVADLRSRAGVVPRGETGRLEPNGARLEAGA
jgi:cysteine desulfurase